jgi:uncharacterized protein (TIGR03435 family)
MTRAFAAIVLGAFLFTRASGQSTSPQTFEVADVHLSPRSTNLFARVMFRGGRYEIRNASMVDLIGRAYGIDTDKVAGGPNWVEFDRFDVIAKAAPNTPPEAIKVMLQALLEERFKLAVHNETKSTAGYVLTSGKGKPKLKESASSGQPGSCQRQPQGPITTVNGQIVIPPNSVSCHNMTMESFASQLRGFDPTYFTNAVVDSTGLKGAWDFDLKWSMKGSLALAGPDGVNIVDAIDKELGLKLEKQKIPTQVVVIDQVNRKPTDDSLDLDAKLLTLPQAEFEVADIKPTAPGSRPTGPIILGFQPGGRVNLPGFPLRLAVNIAWNLNSADDIQGAPKWLSTAQFDIIAKAPAAYVPPNGNPGGGMDDLGPMLRALLIDRFKMKVHFEDQPVTAYTLVAAKPKLKKADPASRVGCKVGNGPQVVATGGPLPLPSRQVTCQNITMAQFVDQLQNIAGTAYIRYPVLDGTGLEGAWDFSLTFSLIPPTQIAGARGAPPSGGAGVAEVGASDPIGGVSLFEAVEKQLGLKLESQKRSYPVFVIDHMEEKPTDN